MQLNCIYNNMILYIYIYICNRVKLINNLFTDLDFSTLIKFISL
jgi:hypothetical protein